MIYPRWKARSADNLHININIAYNLVCDQLDSIHLGEGVIFEKCMTPVGNIRIEDHVYISSSAVIKNGNTNRLSVVGCDPIVTKGGPPHTNVLRNSARPMIKP